MYRLDPQPIISGMSPEWEIIHFHRSARHPRDAVVLCERRNPNAGTEFAEYVVWTANMVEGGCHNGTYRSDYDLAKDEYVRRVGGMS